MSAVDSGREKVNIVWGERRFVCLALAKVYLFSPPRFFKAVFFFLGCVRVESSVCCVFVTVVLNGQLRCLNWMSCIWTEGDAGTVRVPCCLCSCVGAAASLHAATLQLESRSSDSPGLMLSVRGCRVSQRAKFAQQFLFFYIIFLKAALVCPEVDTHSSPFSAYVT